MDKLQRTRLVIVYTAKETRAKLEDIGLTKCTGLTYVRRMMNQDDTIEILFELEEDRYAVENWLTMYRLGQD